MTVKIEVDHDLKLSTDVVKMYTDVRVKCSWKFNHPRIFYDLNWKKYLLIWIGKQT